MAVQFWVIQQWQFPLSALARQTLCYRNSSLSVLGYNLLHMWYDSLMGDCPFQYIFMGRANTFSRLHRDKGGLAILIAPIVGQKEVIMVHREDTHRLYQCRANVYNPDFGEFPLSSFIRAWKVVLEPGDILVMPANTYHAARNLTPCLSYSRFHLDEVNLPLFVQSFLDVDCASMPHAQMIWNMTLECMKVLDRATEDERNLRSQLHGFLSKQKSNVHISKVRALIIRAARCVVPWSVGAERQVSISHLCDRTACHTMQHSAEAKASKRQLISRTTLRPKPLTRRCASSDT